MRIPEVIRPQDIVIDVSAPSKSKLLVLLSEKATDALGINGRDILAALQGREALGSTGIGSGIAIPHALLPGIDGPFGLLVRLAKPIDFQAIDDQPVDIVCLVLAPQKDQHSYLKLLSNIARQLRSHDTVRIIRSAKDCEQVYSAITSCDH